jgi:DNA-directed RNA polymerase subunit alpha
MQVTDFLTPRELHVDKINENHFKVTLEPFEQGFGHTLGNALRRILLSSMEGAAVTDVQIEGVVHEYSTLEGLQEDILDVLMNLKGVAFKLGEKTSAVLTLDKKGPGVVSAKDITLDHDVTIANPDHYIASLTGKGSLNIRMTVKKGCGYEPATARKTEEKKNIGALQVDASFSPVKRVAYSVENARLEGRTDLDKLILDVETDGTLSPEEAIRRAANILSYQLSVFADLNVEASANRYSKDVDPMYFRNLEELGLSVRARNCLLGLGIHYLGDLVCAQEETLLKIPHLGKKSLTEIKALLIDRNLSFNMKINWPPKGMDLFRPAPPAKEEGTEKEVKTEKKKTTKTKAADTDAVAEEE